MATYLILTEVSDPDDTINPPNHTDGIAIYDHEDNPGGNTLPFATDDSYSTPPDTPLTVAAPGILENDGDDDGDPIFPFLDAGPSNGIDFIKPLIPKAGASTANRFVSKAVHGQG